ncbi:efflux RND transporter periplasmic adaptor subunit [uncultured Paraglaciecola sp.]|uniref:HlyD family secretion protein n=1 Tax=uncultured Paraglaciecola sp. TaxID=1765024 RepID=UPI0025E4EA9C|nr:efflux RND transporter periplasmic adaptor subunit [uncultured Paraglaciecola sp.]
MNSVSYVRTAILALSSMWLVACQSEQEPIKQEVVAAKVTASAELISLENATIGPPNVSRMWQYKIQKMAAENKLVKKGEVILVFDGDRLNNNLIDRKSKLKAAVKKAESDKLKDDAVTQNLILQLAEAEMEYEKAKRKAEIVDESRSKIERLKQQADFRYQTENFAQAQQKLAHHKKAMLINVKVSEGKIRSMQSRVNSIEREIAKLSVKAPKDGLVMYRENGDGEKPAVGETVFMGRSLLQLPSLDSIALKAEFAEPDKAKIKQGQAVRVIFEAYPEMSYMGTISKLGQAFYPKSANNPKVIFDAQIELGESRPDFMRPGMKAKIEVIGS